MATICTHSAPYLFPGLFYFTFAPFAPYTLLCSLSKLLNSRRVVCRLRVLNLTR
ncbi:hypothetical protein BDV32DRAFT_132795 [Aspergillus pseudonomiae]|nr:hypothetical protein BDV32DRAFT_132795 [Aspergillus pseudonomiae]